MQLEEMLAYNKQFVEGENYRDYVTDSIPNKRMVLFTCMDSRLVELLPKALNIQNGDVKMVKNAGAILRDPFDSVMKSILVAIYELKAEEVAVIGHHDCGMSKMETEAFADKMKDQGIPQDTLKTLNSGGIDLEQEFSGFSRVEDSVEQSVSIIRSHPLLPEYVKVHGMVIDPHTGKLDVVTKDE
ncbi:beta-class carbonic anhydrase [Lentibacillus sediminis]|uniref:beta-class carbonic anhydrase n=1 Tax=Lentibacillus sediminis TaxID=1940529 RepID=UPI000C1B8F61|nr:carbonic anhydrase [Lentibacillus sediminis]